MKLFIINKNNGGSKMKKILVIIMSIGLMLSTLLTGCSSENDGDSKAEGKTYTIRIGTPTAGKHQQNATMEEFKTKIEAASEGQIVVELYPSSQLGTSVQMIQGVQDGSIEAVLIPSSYFASFAPAVAITDLPFLFESSDQLYEVLNDEASILNDYMEDKGFVVGGWLRNVNRGILSTMPIKSMSDLSGKKIWSLPSATLQDELKAYGASPTTLDPGDIAVALQNGTVDGVETDPIFMGTMKLHTSAKYLNLVPASAMTNAFVYSADWIESLPSDLKDLVLSTTKEVIENFEYDYVETLYQTNIEVMKQEGMEIVEPSESLLKELKNAASPLHDKYINTDSDCKKVYENITSILDK